MIFIIVPLWGGAADYVLTVEKGNSDSASYAEGDTALITADASADGEHFLNWSTADGGSFADLFAPVTTYTMPGKNSKVTANYSVYSGLISSATTKLTSSDASDSAEFGYSVAISGDTAVIGARQDGSIGSAYVFVKSGGVWTQQQKLTASDPAVNDFCGCSVGISGDTIVVGALYNDDGGADSGSVYVFTRVDATWTQQVKLAASDAAAGDHFGESVSISGNSIVVGAPGNGVGGSVYVFTGSDALWTEQAKLNGSDTVADDAFGASVSISGDTLVVGARADDDAGTSSGSAYVFFRNASTWSQQAKLVASDAGGGDQFGFAVSLSGDTIVVGALYDDDGGLSSGSAYVFNRTGTVWTQQAKLVASDAAEGNQFGSSVGISNDTVVVGAVGDDDIASGSGGAYVFLRNGGDWKQQTKLKADDAAANDAFGHSAAISGDNALIGAVRDSGGGSAYTYFFKPAHTLTIVNGTGDGIFLAGDVADPIIADTPAVGHHFVDWSTENGGVIGDDHATSTNYTMPDNDAVVTANFAINTYAVTYNAAANGSIDGDAAQTIDYGSDAAEVTATPNFGYHFVTWDDEVTTATRTDKNITTDLTATAAFAINIYTLTYTATSGGSLTGDASQTVPHGSDGTQVTAVVDPGYHFDGWSDGVLTEARTDTNVTADINATANFALNPSYDLTVENGSGSGTYPEGSIKNVVADIPPEGKIFKNWTVVGGGVIADVNSSATTYEMPGNDAVLTANFVVGYVLTVNGGSGDGSYEPGTEVGITADVPAPGMKFDAWTGDVANIADINAADTTITMPSGTTEITATYKVDETVAVKLTTGSVITINAADTPGSDNEFTSRPSVYGTYIDPLRFRESKSTMRAVSRISSTQPADRFKCEWSRALTLYDRTDLSNQNRQGKSTRQWLSENSIDDLQITLNLKTSTVSRAPIEEIVRGAQLAPPEITSVIRWDAEDPVGAFHARSKIIIKGKFFGSRPPTVGLEYDYAGAKKLQRLKVLRFYKYADARGRRNKSCMDIDETSSTYGESELQVELPKTWRTGLGPGTYDLVLNNRIGLDTCQITIVDGANNADPIANDDSYDLQTGDSSYYLDVLSNDQDADSDTMTIALASRTSDLGGRVSVSRGKIRYTPPRRGVTAPIADKFKYTLADDYGGVSAVPATVSVNIAAMAIDPPENWDGNALASVKNGGLITLRGKNFGIRAPTVTLKYTLSGKERTRRLRVLRSPKYENYRGKAKSSYTDLTTGDSEIQVEMPRSWWRGWTSARPYEIEINNRIGSAAVSINTTSNSTAPVANNDDVTIFSGKQYYAIDVLANDTDAESDKVRIFLPSRISNYGSRLSVDAKTNTVRYYRRKEVLCDFANDTFSYYLRNSAGLVSDTVTVTVSGSLNP